MRAITITFNGQPVCLFRFIISQKKAQSQLIGAQNRHHTIFVTDHMCQSFRIVKSETKNKTKTGFVWFAMNNEMM